MVEIKNETGISQAAHDLEKAKELEKFAQAILGANVNHIRIYSSPNNMVYLSGIESVNDDDIREPLAKYFDNLAAQHRAAAQSWLEFALSSKQ